MNKARCVILRLLLLFHSLLMFWLLSQDYSTRWAGSMTGLSVRHCLNRFCKKDLASIGMTRSKIGIKKL